jgi:hypothetical protein
MKPGQLSITARLWVRFPAEVGIFLFLTQLPTQLSRESHSVGVKWLQLEPYHLPPYGVDMKTA